MRTAPDKHSDMSGAFTLLNIAVTEMKILRIEYLNPKLTFVQFGAII